MKIYLHIGAPRTGTSSFQSILHNNSEALHKAGFEYPHIAYAQSGRGEAQHNLAFTLMEEYPPFIGKSDRISRSQAWSGLKDYLNSVPDGVKAIILSSEAFCDLPEQSVAFMRDFFSDHDLEVLYVERDSRSWHASMARQQIKQYPYRTQIPPPLKGPADSVRRDHLQNWEAVSVPVTLFQYGPKILADLLNHIGLDRSELKSVNRLNNDLPDDLLDLIMRLNSVDLPQAKRGEFNLAIEYWWLRNSRAHVGITGTAELIKAVQTAARSGRARITRLGHTSDFHQGSKLQKAAAWLPRQVGDIGQLNHQHETDSVALRQARVPEMVIALLVRTDSFRFSRQERIAIDAVILQWAGEHVQRDSLEPLTDDRPDR